MDNKKKIRQVSLSSIIGATVEWYDFFLYGVVAGIVFNHLYFPGDNLFVNTLLAYVTFAVGFLARPLGGIVFGHFGDKIGRDLLVFSSNQQFTDCRDDAPRVPAMRRLPRNLEPVARLADILPAPRAIVDQHAAFGIAHKNDVAIIKRHPDHWLKFVSLAYDRRAFYESFSLQMKFDDMRDRLPVGRGNRRRKAKQSA